MDNHINNQAKNEVKELLNALVVSPISDDLKKKIDNVLDDLSKLKVDSKKVNSVIGLIERKSGDLSDKLYLLDEKLDGISRDTASCEETVKTIKQEQEEQNKKVDAFQDNFLQQLEKLDKKLEDEKQGRDKNTDSINAVNTKCIELKDLIDKFNKEFEEEKQSSHKNIDIICAKCDELKDLLVKSDGQIQNNKKSTSDQIENVSQSIDNKAKTLLDSLDGLSTLFKDKNQETSEYHLRQYKQNKVSFILIIILSVINLLGLIGVIIMYLFVNQSF